MVKRGLGVKNYRETKPSEERVSPAIPLKIFPAGRQAILSSEAKAEFSMSSSTVRRNSSLHLADPNYTIEESCTPEFLSILSSTDTKPDELNCKDIVGYQFCHFYLIFRAVITCARQMPKRTQATIVRVAIILSSWVRYSTVDITLFENLDGAISLLSGFAGMFSDDGSWRSRSLNRHKPIRTQPKMKLR